MRFLLSALLVLGCASPVLLEVEQDPSPLQNAVAEVAALEQPMRTVGPDLPTRGVPEDLYHRVTPVADLPLEASTESHNCPPPVIDYWMEPVEPIAPTVTKEPTTGAKVIMLAVLLGVPLLAAAAYTYMGMWRAWRFRKNNA
jgi:hypothetical protein